MVTNSISPQSAERGERVRSVAMTEPQALSALARIAKRWPKSLWLWAASGSLHVMRCGEDGKRVMTSIGGVDPDYSVASIPLPCDGGDW